MKAQNELPRDIFLSIFKFFSFILTLHHFIGYRSRTLNFILHFVFVKIIKTYIHYYAFIDYHIESTLTSGVRKEKTISRLMGWRRLKCLQYAKI